MGNWDRFSNSRVEVLDKTRTGANPCNGELRNGCSTHVRCVGSGLNLEHGYTAMHIFHSNHDFPSQSLKKNNLSFALFRNKISRVLKILQVSKISSVNICSAIL